MTAPPPTITPPLRRAETAIVVFTRAASGAAQRRLGFGVAGDQRARLSLIHRTLDTLGATRAPADVLLFTDGQLAPSTCDAIARLASRRPDARVHRYAQRGASFAARFQDALARTAQHGYQRLVVVGTDTPTLSARDLDRACVALDRAPCAIGPSFDGGFYLLGLHTRLLPLLDALPWRTDRLTTALLARLTDAHCAWTRLPTRADLDTPADAQRILAALRRLARRYLGAPLLLPARVASRRAPSRIPPHRLRFGAAPQPTRGPPRAA